MGGQGDPPGGGEGTARGKPQMVGRGLELWDWNMAEGAGGVAGPCPKTLELQRVRAARGHSLDHIEDQLEDRGRRSGWGEDAGRRGCRVWVGQALGVRGEGWGAQSCAQNKGWQECERQVASREMASRCQVSRLRAGEPLPRSHLQDPRHSI